MPPSTATCPLCSFSAPTERLHAHLQTEHPKRDVCRELLNQASAPIEEELANRGDGRTDTRIVVRR